MAEPKGNQKVQLSQLMRFWASVSCILPIYKCHHAMPSPFAFPASLPSMRAERAVAFRLDVCNHPDLVWELYLEGEKTMSIKLKNIVNNCYVSSPCPANPVLN